MATNCYKPVIERDGTSRLKRLPAGLGEGYVKIDERDFDQLLAFTKKTADLYVYYDSTNTASGGWKEFFNQQLQENGLTAPHFALFAAFLELFEYVQEDLNELGTQHLEFYYRDVLGFAENEAVPDEVFLVAELAKHVSSVELPKGTLFKTGQKVGDIEKLYAFKNTYSFNKATINGISSIYVKDGKQVFASPIANSADGAGEAFETESEGWLPFGDDTRQETPVGIAVEAHTLRMAEGSRIITVTCTLAASSGLNQTLAVNDFDISITGEKEWMKPDLTNLAADGATAESPSVSINGSTLTFKFGYSVAAKPIVDYNTEIHGTFFDAVYPCLKILFAAGATNAARDLLTPLNLKVSSVAVTVTVRGLRTVILQNEQSVLDPAKPVQPFGARPVLKSKFFIGSSEAFSKGLQSVAANFKWRNLPTQSFANHYSQYHSVATKPTNASFTVVPQLLSGNKWTSKTAIRLFDSADGTDTNRPSEAKTLTVSGISGFTADPGTDAGKRYTTVSERGYMAFELSGSDFLHSEFQQSYGKGILKGLDTAVSLENRLNFVPNDPYTPELEEFTLDYTATETINVETGYESNTGRFLHYGPFGTAEQDKGITGQTVSLLPAFDNEGELYIGLANSMPPQNINLLVQVSDGSADPDAAKATVVWSYLSQNKWQPFTITQLLRENTNGFLKTGLVSLSIPSTANSDNTLLPAGMVWLRASVEDNSAAVCKIINVIAQASQAEFDTGNGLTPIGETLPAGTISKLVTPNSAIKSFSQPYASFGGSAQEEGESFYVRVAERLRHKNRAIAVWDYERLILQNFSYVHQVKAINHTIYTGGTASTDYSPLKPGYVTVVLVPDTHNQNAVDPLQPKVSRNSLDEVKAFLESCTTPHAKIEVQNPVYEEIEVRLQVRFIYSADIDVGIATQKLKDKITELLAPWAYSTDAELLFGTKVHKSTLIYHIEKLDYVDFVQCVEMHVHAPVWLNVDSSADLDTAVTSTAASMFTSYSEHTVEPLEGEGCQCEKCGKNLVVSATFNDLEECGCN